jgi:hypothetical protein
MTYFIVERIVVDNDGQTRWAQDTAHPYRSQSRAEVESLARNLKREQPGVRRRVAHSRLSCGVNGAELRTDYWTINATHVVRVYAWTPNDGQWIGIAGAYIQVAEYPATDDGISEGYRHLYALETQMADMARDAWRGQMDTASGTADA